MTGPSPVLGERYRRALVDAAQWHETQTRKGSTVPYVSHVLAVSSAVMEDGGDEDECIAALLHDAVEDCGISRATIAQRFGERVADIVMACTDDTGGDRDNKAPWWSRKVHHIEHLSRFAAAGDLGVIRVTAADKLSNLRSTLDDRDGSVFAVFKAGLGGFAWYHATFCGILVDALRTTPDPSGSGRSPAASVLAGRLESSMDELGARIDRYRSDYAERIVEVLDRTVGVARPLGWGAHDPWPWFALDVAHRARGGSVRVEHVRAAEQGWFGGVQFIDWE